MFPYLSHLCLSAWLSARLVNIQLIVSCHSQLNRRSPFFPLSASSPATHAGLLSDESGAPIATHLYQR